MKSDIKPKYIRLSPEISERIAEDRKNHVVNPYACPDENVVRRNMNVDKASILRPAFVRDCDKIINIPYYNRYADKTQVFSLYRNDDISRRSHHVQLVSRIARNMGRALNLNTDLIEAISLGHDIGHTPFGHAGEHRLSRIYYGETGRYFNHNIQSARVLDKIFPLNLSLQTLDGIICHNGELELKEYRPLAYDSFEVFDRKMEECYKDNSANYKLIPATLEACVMRVCDIIAYLGKDRQDALKLNLIDDEFQFADMGIGRNNAEIINNMTVNIIENSYGKPYIKMDDEFFEAFSIGKRENYEIIYRNESVTGDFEKEIMPMMEEMYYRFLADLKNHDMSSIIYKHHIEYLRRQTRYYDSEFCYEREDPNDIVADFISGMTDDYFIDAYKRLFSTNKHKIKYIGYFD